MAIKKDVWERAKAMYLSEIDWETISDRLNVKKATLMNRASKEGLTRVKREIDSLSSNNKTINTERSLEALSKLVRSKLAADAASTIDRIENYDLDTIRDEATREQILGSVAKRSALVFGWSDTSENATVSINLLGALPDKTLNITPSNEIE
jgi:hypothetical protein